jgi:uncharacterized membrane protein YeaQ/YmgE (transglycosylase-associated protein family)
LAAEVLSTEHLTMITTGFLVGTYARVVTIKEDYRQYPSYPNGWLIHFITGCVAAAIGSVMLPALLTKNFVGISFLTLAIQQFRDVRKTERQSLEGLEKTEFVPRGSAYIDGIAKTFESRNYTSLVVAFICVLAMVLIPGHRMLIDVPAGVIAGFLLIFVLKRFTKGKTLGDIADIKQATLHFKANMLYVEDIAVYNIGLPDVQQRFEREGIAVMLTPKAHDGRIVLANYGQRQAIIHEVARTLGLKRYIYQRRNMDDGRVCFAFIPIKSDIGAMLELVANVPLLESNKKSLRLRNANIIPQGEDA